MTMQVLVTSPRVFFVPKPSDIVGTLFEGPTTASGTYQVKRYGILFDVHVAKGDSDFVPVTLAEINDEGMSFNEIADIIDHQL